MSLTQEQRSVLASRVGITKKKSKAEVQLPIPALCGSAAKPIPNPARLRSILTNGTTPLPTPPVSSPSISPPGGKRKRQAEPILMRPMNKKPKQSLAVSNVGTSNTNKRKHQDDEDAIDLTLPRKKLNTTHQHITPQKVGRQSAATCTIHIPPPIRKPTNAPPEPQPQSPTQYTPTNPPPGMSFSGLRWDLALNNNTGSWISLFIPLTSATTFKKNKSYAPPPTIYPGNMRGSQGLRNLRKIVTPIDRSLPLNHFKKYLRKLRKEDENRADRESQNMWVYEECDEVVEEGKSGSPGGGGGG